MTLHWTKEDTPHWDADKQRLFGPDELAAVGFREPALGAAIADEWWRVTDDDGTVVGDGWLDSEWGDARIAPLVDRFPSHAVAPARGLDGCDHKQ